MTDLLPEGDIVQMQLQSETATVPNGKVWIVTIIAEDGGWNQPEFDLNGDGEKFNIADNEDASAAIEKITLHSGAEVNANLTRLQISGWEFEYS